MSYWNEIFCKRPKRGKKVVIVVGSKKAIAIGCNGTSRKAEALCEIN
jgi:hypothetical protein